MRTPSSIEIALSILCGAVLGVLLLEHFPHGVEPLYGLALLALAATGSVLGLVARVAGSASGRKRSGQEIAQFVVALMLAAFLAGAGRTLLTRHPLGPGDLAWYNNSPESRQVVTVEGIVSAEPVVSDRSQRIRLRATSIRLSADPGQPQEVQGDLVAIVPRYPEHEHGERLSLTGVMTEPPLFPGFDYAAWLARQGINSYFTFPKVETLPRLGDPGPAELISSARQDARTNLRRALSEPQAALAVGVVIGDRSSLPAAVREAFLVTGTSHILAISGQNIALLTGTLLLFQQGSRRRLPVWLVLCTVGLLALYAAFTGATPSVVRAAVMASVLVLAPVFRRRYDFAAALAVTAAAMVLADPWTLSDAGFQLSFLAMWGIGAFASPIARWLGSIRLPGLLAYPIAAALAAQAATLPLSALLFGRVSLISPLATLTAEPALLPLMLCGMLVAALGFMPLIGQLAAWGAWFSASWLVWWVELWASIPFASVPVEDIGEGWVAAYYVAAAAVAARGWAGQRFESASSVAGTLTRAASWLVASRAATICLGVLALVMWIMAIYLVFGG